MGRLRAKAATKQDKLKRKQRAGKGQTARERGRDETARERPRPSHGEPVKPTHRTTNSHLEARGKPTDR